MVADYKGGEHQGTVKRSDRMSLTGVGTLLPRAKAVSCPQLAEEDIGAGRQGQGLTRS